MVNSVVHLNSSKHPIAWSPSTGTSRASRSRDRGHISSEQADSSNWYPAGSAWALVDRARSGDGQAFSTLYESHFREVYSYLLARTHNRADADDFTSETFLRALRRLDKVTYRGSSFCAWLMTIAKNILVDDRRSARRRREVALPDDAEYASVSGDPVLAACNRESRSELLEHLDALTEDQRQCVLLRFFEDLPVAVVAERMRRSNASVRALQTRAIRRLAESMAGSRVQVWDSRVTLEDGPTLPTAI